MSIKAVCELQEWAAAVYKKGASALDMEMLKETVIHQNDSAIIYDKARMMLNALQF